MEEIVALIMIFGVFPISITGMVMYYKLKRMQLKEGGTTTQLSKEDYEYIKSLALENKELRKRIENMELIMHEAALLSADNKK
jgi:5-bromo-4-chloroindolyl phosphate hydrolysis protein